MGPSQGGDCRNGRWLCPRIGSGKSPPRPAERGKQDRRQGLSAMVPRRSCRRSGGALSDLSPGRRLRHPAALSERSTSFRTPNWSAGGFDIYNVRDLHIVFGDTLVVSAPASRFRLFESHAFQDMFYRHFFDDGLRWITAPLPRLKGEYRHEIQRPPSALEATEDSLHQRLSHGLGQTYHYLDEDEIIFDAANIIRIGRDILFLVSSTANRKAAAWLAGVLGPDYRVHVTHTYRASHLDSTILPLRSGT